MTKLDQNYKMSRTVKKMYACMKDQSRARIYKRIVSQADYESKRAEFALISKGS